MVASNVAAIQVICCHRFVYIGYFIILNIAHPKVLFIMYCTATQCQAAVDARLVHSFDMLHWHYYAN